MRARKINPILKTQALMMFTSNCENTYYVSQSDYFMKPDSSKIEKESEMNTVL